MKKIPINTMLTSALFVSMVCMAACSGEGQTKEVDSRTKALALWESRCKKSGEFIKKTVDDVDGIWLLKIRDTFNRDNQYTLDDPYGHDSTGDQYIIGFLRSYLHQNGATHPNGTPKRQGYKYVVAMDPADQKSYIYTGGMKVVGRKNVKAPGVQFELGRNPEYDLNIYDYVLQKNPASLETPRYGVTYDDISTPEDRKYWIAGSSLKIIDMTAREVIAERVGYMVDLGQGNRSGGRAPWLMAASNACPDFMRNYKNPVHVPKFVAQSSQTLIFVEKVLKPSR